MTRAPLLAIGMALGLAAAQPWPEARAQTQPEAPATARGGTEIPTAERRLPQERQKDPIRAHDLDHDGTLDLAETKRAAALRYDAVNPDLDDALDRKEARRLPKGVFQQADGDHNGQVSKAEYLALVERRFQAADPDGDGTLDRAELRAKPGQALRRLMP